MTGGAVATRVAAVVVTYQSASTIDECLTRLRAAEGVDAIRVVDNDSRDDTLEVVQRHAVADARVRFIANPDNPGFSVACNQGARDVDAAWLAFVNPDCLVERDTFTRMLALVPDGTSLLLGADLVDEAGRRDPAARRSDPDFGRMLQGVLRNPAGKSQLAVAIDDTLPLQPVEAVSGALMLLPRALFQRVGGFDEGYRLHAEDLDLCRRVRAAGGAVAVANAVRVLHVRGVSSRSRPVFVEWHKHRGLWRYFSRFEAPQRGALVRAAVFLAIWLRFPLSVLRAALKR
ncbi:MAG: glycosyltransferase family 2 protein [Lysobacter sp.]|nr:glycosyltransferase family 2 protein [Lysobacter sp.]